MVETEGTIRFAPGDTPELPELHGDGHGAADVRRTPEPSGWRPIGDEW